MAAHDPRKRADALARSLTDLLAPVVADAGLHLEGVETTRAGKYSVAAKIGRASCRERV